MCQLVNQAARDPFVKRCAIWAVENLKGGVSTFVRGGNSRSIQAQAESCWWFCKHFLKFEHHGQMFTAWASELGDPQDKLQLLIAPDVLLKMRTMKGDCAIYTMMVAALLKSLGIGYEIVTAAVDASQPEIFSHVWARAILENAREPLDASHGDAPGWQVPSQDIFRIQGWDESARPVADRAQRFSGLHDYRRTRRRRGFGQVEDVQEGGTYSPPSGTGGDYFPVDDFPSGGYTAPSRNSTDWSGFASNLAKMGLTLAEINAIQPGTVVGPNGQILRQSPGYAVPGGSQIAAGFGGSSSLVLIGGGLLALLVVGSMLKK